MRINAHSSTTTKAARKLTVFGHRIKPTRNRGSVDLNVEQAVSNVGCTVKQLSQQQPHAVAPTKHRQSVLYHVLAALCCALACPHAAVVPADFQWTNLYAQGQQISTPSATYMHTNTYTNTCTNTCTSRLKHVTHTSMQRQSIKHHTTLHFTSPHLTVSHVTSPHCTPCHLTSPHLTVPHVTSPHLTSLYPMSPHLTDGCIESHCSAYHIHHSTLS